MEDDIRHILAVLYFSLGLHFVEVIALLALAMSRDGRSIGGILPSVNDYAKRNFGYVTKIVRKKLKNMNGAAVVPDVSDEIMSRFVNVLLHEVDASASIEDVKLTEPVWVKSGKFAETVGGSPEQFRACMKRLEAARIAVVIDKRGTRGWAMPYRSIRSKLRNLLPVEPLSHAKAAQNGGVKSE